MFITILLEVIDTYTLSLSLSPINIDVPFFPVRISQEDSSLTALQYLKYSKLITHISLRDLISSWFM